ncbi:MAG: penicillin-binding transpeptidase domain-containing protein, partial [Actinomycetota bacterium]|nr:penicillin-binding transpeptidase domain-containing protein [Actinomycetota bacterium]
LQPPKAPEGKRVISKEVAEKATEIMVGDITNGIAGKAGLEDRPVAGKTGTSERFFDAWFVGFTPQLVTGIWSGYSEGGQTLESLLGPDAQEQFGTVPSPTIIFHDYMMKALEGEPKEQFEGVETPEPRKNRRASQTPEEQAAPVVDPVTGLEVAPEADPAAVDPAAAEPVALDPAAQAQP